MDLKDKFQELVPKLFNKFTGIPFDVIYVTVTSTYILGGEVDNQFTEYATRAIQSIKEKSNLGASNVNRGITQNINEAIDIEFMISTLELSVEPKDGDLIIVGNKMFVVSFASTDPANAMWVIDCGKGGIDMDDLDWRDFITVNGLKFITSLDKQFQVK